MPKIGTNPSRITRSVKAASTVGENLFFTLSNDSGRSRAATTAVSGGICHGIAEHDASAGEVFTALEGPGDATVLSGAGITAGAELMSNAAGKAITATTGKYVKAHALQSATGADEKISVVLYNSPYLLP